MHPLVASLVLAVAASAAAVQQAPPQPGPPAQAARPAPPPPYNPAADARAQIASALKSAKDDGIRVLVNWGSNEDEASTAFAAARRNNRDLSPFFSTEYKLVHVDVGNLDKNLDVAKTYGVTLQAGALPMLAVLDGDGNVLARTSASAFRSTADPAAFDPASIGAFLAKHQAPAPADADPVLQAAVKQAKREGKTLFVWFSAPW